MKHTLFVLCIIAAALGFLTNASAEEMGGAAETMPTESGVLDGILSDTGIEVSADVAFNSLYMWRGIMLDGDAVVQPGFYVTSPESKFGRVKLGIWFNHDLENKDNLKSSETDYIFDYTYSFPSVDLSAGFIYYDFPDATPPDGAPRGFSREVYGGIGFPKLPLSPSVYYYYDFGRKVDGGGEGSYTVVNLSHSIPFTLRKYNLSLDLSGHAGFNNKQYYAGTGGDAAVGAGITIPLLKGLSCQPNINYTVPWGNLSDKNNGNQKNRLYGGVYFSYVF